MSNKITQKEAKEAIAAAVKMAAERRAAGITVNDLIASAKTGYDYCGGQLPIIAAELRAKCSGYDRFERIMLYLIMCWGLLPKELYSPELLEFGLSLCRFSAVEHERVLAEGQILMDKILKGFN